MSYRYGSWKPYVPVAQRRAKAERQALKLAKSGVAAQPVRIEGRAIARSFWGNGWCHHLETFSDFENRLPRGRSYVRSGAVCHLEIGAGRVDARVAGSSLYTVKVAIAALKPADWTSLKRRCAGEIGSLLELLQGKLSGNVMTMVSDRDHGLFPRPGEMKFSCSCPDWAGMCKHVAAVLYGVGNRLDLQPELLFLLRGVEAAGLIDASLATARTKAGPADGRLADDRLAAIFDIDLDDGPEPPAPAATKANRTHASKLPVKKRLRPTSEATTAGFRATGKSIAALRKRQGLSVAAFARELSVSPGSVQRWESAGAAPLNLHARCLSALSKLNRNAPARKNKR